MVWFRIKHKRLLVTNEWYITKPVNIRLFHNWHDLSFKENVGPSNGLKFNYIEGNKHE